MSEERSPNKHYNEYETFAFHPYNVLLFLILFGISALFLSLTLAFIYSRVQSDLPPIRLPLLFLFNTFILVASSLTMVRASRAYRSDHARTFLNSLTATVGLSLVFLILQFVAWGLLFQQDILIDSHISASYLYLISGLHFAHVIAGIPFLGMFIWRTRKQLQDPVSSLVFFSDPEKRLRLRLLGIYWHFLDGLWIYLIAFFFVNQFLQS